jgi:DNA-binding response OmpR family regulator
MARKKRITVINDYPAFLEMVSQALTDEGYDVQTIPKFQGAFDQLKSWESDLIVLDLVLGNAEAGWELLDLIKFDPETSKLPILLCSAATKDVREVAPSLSAKGVEYLEKPFELDVFLAKLAKMIEDSASKTEMEPKRKG